MQTIRHPDGRRSLIRTTALHARRRRRLSPYARPTDWHAQAFDIVGIGHTRREAVADLHRRVVTTDLAGVRSILIDLIIRRAGQC